MDEQQAMEAALAVGEHYMRHMGADLIDGRTLVKAAMAGYLAASGVPTDQAVAMVEKTTRMTPVSPMPPNPMYHGLPWLVPGPTSGVPYYK